MNEMRKEYGNVLKGGVRGKYLKKYKEGTNLVLIAPDLAKLFKTEDDVNNALRLLARVAKKSVKTN